MAQEILMLKLINNTKPTKAPIGTSVGFVNLADKYLVFSVLLILKFAKRTFDR